ncbi:MAG TPA: asparaginase [Longimicrobiales bacterium]|nr:asparaginase [Longimicrobiales bacterium]
MSVRTEMLRIALRGRGAGKAWLLLALVALPGAARAEAQELPTVVVLSTGGTIASVYDPAQGGFVAALTGEALVRAVPGLDTLARVEVVQVANVGSTDMTPALWLDVSRRADTALARTDVAGVVVTHGTDTLEETAFFLDLTVASEKPVIVVGAQRAASEPDADGPRNLRDAIRTAVAPASRGMGTLVVLNGEIHAAREVTKTSTLNVSTFLTPQFGALGTIDPDGVRYSRAPLRRQHIAVAPDAVMGRVEIVTNYAGADGSVVRGILAQGGLDGLVVEASGVGNLSSALFGALQEVRARGIPVVVSTRVHSGRTLPLYAGRGSGVSLAQIGCVFADNLSPHKARVLLLAALTRTSDSAVLARMFAH